MLFKVLTIFVIVTLLAVLWWHITTGNIVYFTGSTMIQIPNPLFTTGRKDELSIALKFPIVRNGIVLFMRRADNFQIVYIHDGELVVNNNNDATRSLIMTSDLKKHGWLRFGFTIGEEFKDTPVYFGGAPIEQIPINTLMYDGRVIQFPRTRLMACTNNCYLNSVNLSELFQKRGLRTYC